MPFRIAFENLFLTTAILADCARVQSTLRALWRRTHISHFLKKLHYNFKQ